MVDKQMLAFYARNMNATENSPKPNARLKRVRRIILIVRLLLALTVATVIGIMVLFLTNIVWGTGLPSWIVGIPFSPHVSYRPPFNQIPGTVVLLGIVRAGLCFAGVLILNQFLRACSSGAFLAARNISCHKWLGGLVIGDWMLTKLLDWIVTRIFFVEFGELALGFLIFLIAWIVDEGRKIQEEHELTV